MPHTPLLYLLFACSTVLYFVLLCVIGCRDSIDERGTTGRACFVLEKQRWHCRVGNRAKRPAANLEDATVFDIFESQEKMVRVVLNPCVAIKVNFKFSGLFWQSLEIEVLQIPIATYGTAPRVRRVSYNYPPPGNFPIAVSQA